MDYASKGVAGTGLGLGIECELATRDEAKNSIEGSK